MGQFARVTFLLLLLTASVSHAQCPTKSWLRFDVIGGRLTAHSTRASQGKTCYSSTPEEGVERTVSASVYRGLPTFHLELKDPHEQVTIDFERGDEVSVRRQFHTDPGERATTVEFQQQRAGNLTLIVETGDTRREYRATSFWHLMLAHRAACEQYLVPTLEMLRPDWGLATTVEKLEASLLKVAASPYVDRRDEWRELVVQLRSGSFRQRQSADRQLHQVGQAVIPFLDRLDAARLDAEQRSRIRGIRESLTVADGDTPARIAAWSVDDEAIWLALMSHEDSAMRQIAVSHLRRTSRHEITFDPLGDAETRAARIANLRKLHGLD